MVATENVGFTISISLSLPVSLSTAIALTVTIAAVWREPVRGLAVRRRCRLGRCGVCFAQPRCTLTAA